MVHHGSGRLLDVVDVIIEQRTREPYERFKRLLEMFHGTDSPEFLESLSSESLGDSPKAWGLTSVDFTSLTLCCGAAPRRLVPAL